MLPWSPPDIPTIFAMAVNAAGDVFLVGESDPDVTTVGRMDAVLVKFSGFTPGAPLWIRRWGTPEADGAAAVTTDPDGNIYVLGATGGNLDGNLGAGNTDAFLTLFSPQGTKLWTRQWGTSGTDAAGGLLVTPNREIYVTGSTDGAFTEHANGGLFDLFVTRWGADGNIDWTLQSATAGSDLIGTGPAIASDPASGAIYVTATVGKTNPSGYRGLLLRLTPE
jgi:hypothetical protein